MTILNWGDVKFGKLIESCEGTFVSEVGLGGLVNCVYTLCKIGGS